MRHTKLEIGIQLFVQMLCLVIIVIGLTEHNYPKMTFWLLTGVLSELRYKGIL